MPQEFTCEPGAALDQQMFDVKSPQSFEGMREILCLEHVNTSVVQRRQTSHWRTVCKYNRWNIARAGNQLKATLFNEYDKSRHERLVDQVVVEHGTLPLDELYLELKPGSRNLGEVDYAALIAGRPQQIVRNPAGGYLLYRIGDAVSSRNIHAAVYDALRLAKDL